MADTARQTELLLKSGADVNAKNQWGETPIFQAHSEEQLKLLINAGADVNVRAFDGSTPIHHMSSSRLINILVEAGADLTAHSTDSQSVFPDPEMVEEFGTILNLNETIKALIQGGADPQEMPPQVRCYEDIPKFLTEKLRELYKAEKLPPISYSQFQNMSTDRKIELISSVPPEIRKETFKNAEQTKNKNDPDREMRVER